MKIPFAFWGQGETDLPIVSSLRFEAKTVDTITVKYTLIDSGKNEPVYAYGIVYSTTEPLPTLNTPGVQVSPIGTNFPANLPANETHIVTGLDDTTEYYFRVFATNNQGQPQDDNTFYSNVLVAETAWEAFEFSYAYNFVKGETPNDNFINLGNIEAQLGTRTQPVLVTSYSNVNVTYDIGTGPQAIKVKLEYIPINSLGQVEEKEYYFDVTSGNLKIDIPKSDLPNEIQGDLKVSVAYDDSFPLSTFNNFAFGKRTLLNNQSFSQGYHATNAGIRILKWGPSKWKIWDYMFQGDEQAINPANNSPGIGSPVDTPDLSECTSWFAAFKSNQQAWSGDYPNEQKLGDFDLSNIVDAFVCFKDSNVCGLTSSGSSKPLKDANWDSCQIFEGCFDVEASPNNKQIKLDVSGWTFNQNNDDISMHSMFNYHTIGVGGAASTQAGLASWDVSNVINFERFLNNATYFDENLGSWDVSKAKNMSRMFSGASSVNFDASSWVVNQVADYFNFSTNATSWVLPQPNFPFIATNNNIQAAVNAILASDPTGTTAVSPYGFMSDFNTSSVTNMSDLFYNKQQFNADISGWDTSNVTNMAGMFERCVAFNQPIGNWDVSSVTRMDGMLKETDVFNQPLGNWDVSNVTRFERMFFEAIAFNQDISTWDISSVDDSGYQQGLYQMFYKTTSFNTSLNGWVLPATLTDISGLFYQSGYNSPLDQWDVSNITKMTQLFLGSDFNQDISMWDVSNVTSMFAMFRVNTVFNQPIGSWDVSSLTSTAQMFYGATAFNQDLSNWNAPNLDQIQEMFRQSNFNSPLPDLTLVGDQRGIFYLNSQFNQDISGWDVSGVTLFFYAFRGASSFNQDIGNWDVSGAFSFGNMFRDASSFDQNLEDWEPILASSTSGFMQNITLSTANYDALLIGWAAAMEAEYPSGTGYTLTPSWNFGNSVHTTGGTAETAKNTLINTFNWTITDGNP